MADIDAVREERNAAIRTCHEQKELLRISEQESDASQTEIKRLKTEYKSIYEKHQTERLENGSLRTTVDSLRAKIEKSEKTSAADVATLVVEIDAMAASLQAITAKKEESQILLTVTAQKRDEAMASLKHLSATIAQQSEYIGSLENQRRVLWKANTALVDRSWYDRVRNTIPQGDFIPPFNPDGFSEISGDSPVMVGAEFRPLGSISASDQDRDDPQDFNLDPPQGKKDAD